MPEEITTDIVLTPGGGSVFCAIGSNPRTSTSVDITRFPLPDGDPVTDPEGVDADPKARIPLGEPEALIRKMIIQADGRVVRNPASGDSTYSVVLRFYQGSSKVGESAPVSGDFGSKNTIRYRIICPLK